MTNPFIRPEQQQAPQNPYAQQSAFQQGAASYPSVQPMQPQYAPRPQYSGAPAGNGLVAQPGQFVPIGAPPADASGDMPRLSDLTGRLILFLPERLERGVPSQFKNDDGSPRSQDRLTATLVILDGGPVVWGGQTPATPRQQEQIPYVAKAFWISQSKIISQLDAALQLRLSGGPGLTIGRLWKTGTEQNSPYVLQEPNAQDVQIYSEYVSRVNPFVL